MAAQKYRQGFIVRGAAGQCNSRRGTIGRAGVEWKVSIAGATQEGLPFSDAAEHGVKTEWLSGVSRRAGATKPRTLISIAPLAA